VRRAAVAVLGVLAATDIVTSLWGLTHGYPEAAPAMGWAVANLGVWSVAPIKVALSLAVVALIRRVDTRSPRLAWTIAMAVFALPAVSNVLRLVQAA
jgi:uncharacterized membrane protein